MSKCGAFPAGVSGYEREIIEHTDRAACDQFVADFKAGRSYSEPLTHGAGI